jgi:hypothetical protein
MLPTRSVFPSLSVVGADDFAPKYLSSKESSAASAAVCAASDAVFAVSLAVFAVSLAVFAVSAAV